MHGNPRKVKSTSPAKTLELCGQNKSRGTALSVLCGAPVIVAAAGCGAACSLRANQVSPGFSPVPGRLCPVPLYSSSSSPLSLTSFFFTI